MIVFRLHPDAYRDLDEIWEFIAVDSPAGADRVLEKIYDAISALVSFPHQGHRRPDLTSRPLRFVACDPYLIAYVPDAQPLWVVAVLHGSRNPRRLAALLRGRRSSAPRNQ